MASPPLTDHRVANCIHLQRQQKQQQQRDSKSAIAGIKRANNSSSSSSTIQRYNPVCYVHVPRLRDIDTSHPRTQTLAQTRLDICANNPRLRCVCSTVTLLRAVSTNNRVPVDTQSPGFKKIDWTDPDASRSGNRNTAVFASNE